MYDLLITGGLVLDGAGNPGQYLSIGVRDGARSTPPAASSAPASSTCTLTQAW